MPRRRCTCEKQCLLTRVLGVCEGNSTNHPKTLLVMSGENVFVGKNVCPKILSVKNRTKIQKNCRTAFARLMCKTQPPDRCYVCICEAYPPHTQKHYCWRLERRICDRCKPLPTCECHRTRNLGKIDAQKWLSQGKKTIWSWHIKIKTKKDMNKSIWGFRDIIIPEVLNPFGRVSGQNWPR